MKKYFGLFAVSIIGCHFDYSNSPYAQRELCGLFQSVENCITQCGVYFHTPPPEEPRPLKVGCLQNSDWRKCDTPANQTQSQALRPGLTQNYPHCDILFTTAFKQGHTASPVRKVSSNNTEQLVVVQSRGLVCKSNPKFAGFFGMNVGYRQDDILMRFSFPQQSGKESFKWPANNIFQVGGEFYLVYKNIYVRGMGDWGKICGGTKSITATQQIIPNFPPGTDLTTFTASQTKGPPGGYVYDVSGGLAYRFYLDHDHLMIAPILGYSLHEQVIKENKLSGETTINTSTFLPRIEKDDEKRTVKLRWYGPSAGIDLAYQTDSSWNFFGNYAWTWGKVNFLGTATLALVQTSPVVDPPPTETAKVFRNVLHRTAFGQNVNVGLAYKLCHYNRNNPTIGLTGNYQLWTARKNAAVDKIDELTSQETVTTVHGTGLLGKMRWQIWGITFDIGFTF